MLKITAAEVLHRFFHEASEERRLAIVRALGWAGETGRRTSSLEALHDESAEVKADAVFAKTAGPKALDALIEALGAPNEAVRAAFVDVWA